MPTSGTITSGPLEAQQKAFRYTYTSGATNQDASNLFGDDYAVNYPKEIYPAARGEEIEACSLHKKRCK